jgi:hypothetical protein
MALPFSTPARRQHIQSVTSGLGFFGHPSPQWHPVGTYSVRGSASPRTIGGYSVPSSHCCIRRAVLSTGFVWQCMPGQWFRLPAPSPVPFWLQRVSLLRWVKVTMAHHTFACATLRYVLNGIPGVRLPGSAFYPRSRPLRTSRRPGGYAVTPAPGGRGLHPHEELSYKVDTLRLAREPRLSFSQRIARDPL